MVVLSEGIEEKHREDVACEFMVKEERDSREVRGENLEKRQKWQRMQRRV